MRSPGEWLKPPGTLLLILFLFTLVSVSALGWFGWRLLRQDRLVEAQRSQERLEEAADRIAATLRGTLAETGDRLRAWASNPPSDSELPPGSLLLLITDNSLAAMPAGRLLYYPSAAAGPEADAAVFGEAEVLEFQLDDPGRAAPLYERLARSRNAAIRAGALMRLGRALRKLGRNDESRLAYAQLAAISDATAAGVPAELVARQALCEFPNGAAEAGRLQSELLGGRWRLTRGQFEFYWSEASRLSGHETAPPADSTAWSEAAALAWSESRRDAGARGQTTLWAGGQPFFAIWRGESARRAVLLIQPGPLFRQIPAGGDVSFAAVDAEGRALAGRRGAPGSSHAAVRTAAESLIPWTLYVTAAGTAGEDGAPARQRFLLLMISMMTLFLVVGGYFVARAIRREAEIGRMQSDFVSAVSHEFRSPLTSMRQLSEILAFGRAPSEVRRQLYYETLVKETARLQRLVEALLNFGRMEAGARKYRFEEIDVAALVRRVASEFEPQAAGAGRRIQLEGPPAGCTIEADPEAISVALRNLVDNALKYSPNHPTVWVEWRAESHRVAILVRDKGPGISAAERKVIFRKFVRGSAAEAANVRGSGVGLAMARHIVAAHGGEITVASVPGEGSTFQMLLPGVETT
jgi:signal transduction histidine kinase